MAEKTIFQTTPKCPICKGNLSYSDSVLHQSDHPIAATLMTCTGSDGSKYGGCGYRRWDKKAPT